MFEVLGYKKPLALSAEFALKIYEQLLNSEDTDEKRVSLLNNQLTMLSDLGRQEEASNLSHEAIHILRPFFWPYLQPMGNGWLRWAKPYIGLCESASTEPDGDLLDPIVTELKKMLNGEKS